MAYYVTNDNSFLDIKNAHLRVTGNVHTDVLKVGSIGFQPAGSNISGTVNFTNVTTGVTTSSNLDVGGTLNLGTIELSASTHTLDHITARGNVTSTTVQFDNATTGLVTTANVEVGGELTVTGNATVSENLTVSANVEVGGELTVSSNIEVAGFVGSSGTGALTLPSGTTAEQPTGVGGMIRFNSSSNRMEVYNGTSWQSIGGVSATQSAGSGTTALIGGYRIHTFTSSGSLVVNSGGEVDYLVVAGGGGAGSGGGGAGGMLTGTIPSLAPNTYTITVGVGGAGGGGGGPSGGQSSTPSNGSNSTALGVTADGGGRGGGGSISGRVGSDGGSGGGHGYDISGTARTSGTTGQGNGGGRSGGGSLAGGGGGASP